MINRLFYFPPKVFLQRIRKRQKPYNDRLSHYFLIACEWDDRLKKEFGVNELWYSSLSTDRLRFAKQEKIGDIESRNKSLRDDIRRLCNRAQIYYRSPYKLWRGHGVYAVKNSNKPEELQAFSQNIGHEDPGTTYKYYS